MAKLRDVALKIAGEVEHKTGLYYLIEDDSSENEIIVQLKAKKFQVGWFAVIQKDNMVKITKRFGAAGEIELSEFLNQLEAAA